MTTAGAARLLRVDVPQETLAHIRSRVANYPWHEMPDDGGWAYGSNLDCMRDLCDYWVHGFDWRKQEAALNRFSHWIAPVEGIDLHYIHEKGSGPRPMPLLISHGWPGSVVEFLDIIEPLAHPQRFGGSVEDAFDVIAPPLPGFGFSGRPPRPYGPRRIAGVFNALMTGVLGYDGYLAQGGDWGAAISSWLGMDHAPACKAIHINCLTMRSADGPQSTQERAWAERIYNVQRWTKMPRGGHFAALEEPQRLVDDIRAFARQLR